MKGSHTTLLDIPKYELDFSSVMPGASYASRRMTLGYTGSLMTVRRLSDNTTLSIGFLAGGYITGGTLDIGTLLGFVNGSSGFVTQWNDESGNGRNVTQVTAASQPQIVASGVVETKNNQPTVVFNGTSMGLSNTSPFLGASSSATVNSVTYGGNVSAAVLLCEDNATNTVNTYYIFGNGSTGTGNSIGSLSYWRRTGTSVDDLKYPTLSGTAYDSTLRVMSWKDSGTAVIGYNNGSAGTTASYTRSSGITPTAFGLGEFFKTGTSSNFYSGGVSEINCFTGVLTNDLTNIQHLQASKYQIPVP